MYDSSNVIEDIVTLGNTHGMKIALTIDTYRVRVILPYVVGLTWVTEEPRVTNQIAG
jgi:hypothetical protein